MEENKVEQKVMRIVKLCMLVTNKTYSVHMSYTGSCDAVGIFISDEVDDKGTVAWANFSLPNGIYSINEEASVKRLNNVIFNLERMLEDAEYFKRLPQCTWQTDKGIYPYDLEASVDVL